MHRSFRFGDLVELWMLDERRYRDQPPQNALLGYGSVDPAIEDPTRTMLGVSQREWLVGGLKGSSAAWKVLGNPVQFFPLAIGPALLNALNAALAPALPATLPLPPPLLIDGWDGYATERRTLLAAIDAVSDVVVLTGDYHESFVADLPPTPETYLLDGYSAGVEFVAPPVNSPNLGETFELAGFPSAATIDAVFEANLTANNPWVKYHDGVNSGYGVVEFTATSAHYDFVFVSNKLDRDATASVAASWQVVRGAAVASPAAGPLPTRVRSSGAAGSPPTESLLAATGPTSPGLAAAAAAGAVALAARRLRDVATPG